jgi:hypothetical protein
MSAEAADARLQAYVGKFEMVQVNLTFDPSSFEFGGLDHLLISCIRLSDRAAWNQAQVFQRVCSADVDEAEFLS